jgi:hypothetical protein
MRGSRAKRGCVCGLPIAPLFRGDSHPPVCAEDVIDPDPELAAFFDHWNACESCNEV